MASIHVGLVWIDQGQGVSFAGQLVFAFHRGVHGDHALGHLFGRQHVGAVEFVHQRHGGRMATQAGGIQQLFQPVEIAV